ncbi:hypothetical protein VZT92_026749 [Zoarces viviparus]|uniref:Uncharacterized protein n=1 Tax=Zoarces viviparus TaxID=48416 RepID=A0AAW1DR29_ZOAVI
MALAVSDSGPRANGLLERFLEGKTVLGLLVDSEVLGELECLNGSLQKQSEMVGCMQAAVAYVTSILQEKRSDEKFQELFEKAEAMVEKLGLEPVQIPHQRAPPKRFTAEAERSFSALKKLKTWLRSTMSQQRLNNVSVCHVHQATLDKIELKDVGQQFISVNDRRRYLFGVFK